MTLNSSQLDTISKHVYRQFPELKGAPPAVQTQSLPSGTKGPASGGKQRYVVTFKASGVAADGRALSRVVRVVADERGHILKVSTTK
ncbi:MAG: hypothetical protein HY260_13830 [Chloroflexi bacterium]|nr:hypothetical protein [Chloroflexota bacterium]